MECMGFRSRCTTFDVVVVEARRGFTVENGTNTGSSLSYTPGSRLLFCCSLLPILNTKSCEYIRHTISRFHSPSLSISLIFSFHTYIYIYISRLFQSNKQQLFNSLRFTCFLTSTNPSETMKMHFES